VLGSGRHQFNASVGRIKGRAARAASAAVPARITRQILLTGVTLLPLLTAAAAGADDPAPTYVTARALFRAAYSQAFTTRTLDDANDDATLKHYVLYPYLQAARLRSALQASADWVQTDRRAAAFMATYGQFPVARGVRRAWLESLARRSQWELFLGAYQELSASTAVRCQSFIGRIALGKTHGLADAITGAWLTPEGEPDCQIPFAWLKERGGLSTDLVEERARLALESDRPELAREVIRQLPAQRAAPLAEWASLLENPEPRIDALIASPATPVTSTALLEGWTRLARTRPSAAKERYASLVSTRGLRQATASRYALALALSLARSRDPAAIEYFDRVAARDLDDAALSWRARAALWSQDWDGALQSIAELSAASRATARWRYWQARAAEASGAAQRARPLYESLLADDNYYSAMAAARLGRAPTPHPSVLQTDAALMKGIEQLPALTRARELFLCGLRPEAAAEWRFGYESLTPQQRLQAIPLAVSWGWYDQAIAAAASQRVFNDYVLLYPRPFEREVEVAARLNRLEPELIYGVLRQESLYRVDAVSRAGARGLMQLMPSTARATARHSGLHRPQLADLFDPATNIALGAATLRRLLDGFDDQMPVALAGYNAGALVALRWLPAGPIDGDIWIENIPYDETRDYVQRVIWHSALLRWLQNAGPGERGDAWLASVKPVPDAERATHLATSR